MDASMGLKASMDDARSLPKALSGHPVSLFVWGLEFRRLWGLIKYLWDPGLRTIRT